MKKVSTFNANDYGLCPQMMEALEVTTPRGTDVLVNQNIFKRVSAALKKGAVVQESDVKPVKVALEVAHLIADLEDSLASAGSPKSMTVSELATAVGVRDKRVITTLSRLERGKLHVNHQNCEIVEKSVKVVYGLWAATAEKPQARRNTRTRQHASK